MSVDMRNLSRGSMGGERVGSADTFRKVNTLSQCPGREGGVVQEAHDDDEIPVENGIRKGSKEEEKEALDWMFVNLSLKNLKCNRVKPLSSDAEGRDEVTERQQSKCLASGEGVSQASYAPIAENPL